MVKPRDYTKYEYRKGNKVRHVGITNDPKRREQEHQKADPGGRLIKSGYKVAKESALKWEREQAAKGKPTEGYR